jgi:hypothetical protein
MTALEELPDKDKDLILPIIPLKGWVGSHELKNSIPRIEKAIGKRRWIADIDASFLTDNKEKRITGEYPREVFYEIEKLLLPKDGYDNWVQYIKGHKNVIPTVQLGNLKELDAQLAKLNSLSNGVVVRFTTEHIESSSYRKIIQAVKNTKINDVFIIFDYEQVTREILTFSAAISSILLEVHEMLPTALFAISCSSFPSSFSGSHNGENPIYERLLYNNVSGLTPNIRKIYSDRGSARADKIGGGGGIPSPRIDYALANDWRFIREEFEDSTAPEDGEKEELYASIANKIIKSNYWNAKLRIWATQVIELTSRREMLGINSAMRSTAVRINMHMHQQLYYAAPEEDLLDTDEDWKD